MEKSKVSIVTPVYNSEKFISLNIQSILDQSYESWEHILIDDCSFDNSVEIIENYAEKDDRIKLIKLEENSGAGVARNIGIEAANGRFIAFLDADDYWHNDKLRKQIDFMLKNNYGFSYTQYYVIKDFNNPEYIVKSPKKIGYSDILNNCYVGCLTAMYDTKLVGKQFMPNIRKRQDWVLWIKILKVTGEAYGLQEPLAYYRIGNNSLSNNKLKLIKHNFNVYNKVLEMGYIKSCYRMFLFFIFYFKFKIFSIKKIKNG